MDPDAFEHFIAPKMASEYSSSKKSSQPGSLTAESTNSLVKETDTEKPEPLGFKTKWYQFKNDKFGNLKMAIPTMILKQQTRTANQDLNESHVVNESSSCLVRSKVPKPASELVLCRDVTLYDWTSFPRILNLATFKFAQTIESFTAHKNQPNLTGDAWDMAYSCFLKPGRSTSNSEGIILNKMENVEGDIFLSVSQYIFDEIAKKIHLFLTLTEAKLAFFYTGPAENIIIYLNTCEISVVNQFLSESSRWTFGNQFVGQDNIQRGISTIITGTAKLLNTEISFQDVYITVIGHAISISIARLYQRFQVSTKHVLLFHHHKKYIINAIVKLGCREVACQYNRENIESRLTVFLEKMYEELYENGIHKKISKLKKKINSIVSEIRGNFKNEISRIMKQDGSFSDLHAFHKGFHNALHITVCQRLIFKTNHDSEIIDHVVTIIGKDLEVDMQTYNEIYNVTNPNRLNIVHPPQSPVEYLKTSRLPETIVIFISYDEIACGIVVDHYLYKITSASLNNRSKIWISESDTGVMNECDPMFSQCVKNQNVAMYSVEDALGLVWKPRLPKLPFNSTAVTQELLFSCVLKWLFSQCRDTLWCGNYRFCIVVPPEYSCIKIQKLKKATSLIDEETTLLTTTCCHQLFCKKQLGGIIKSPVKDIGVQCLNGLERICHVNMSIRLFSKKFQSTPSLVCCYKRGDQYDNMHKMYDFKMYCGVLSSFGYSGRMEQSFQWSRDFIKRKFSYHIPLLNVYGRGTDNTFNLSELDHHEINLNHKVKEKLLVCFFELSDHYSSEFIGALFIEAAETKSNTVITCRLTRQIEFEVDVNAPHYWSQDVMTPEQEVQYRSIYDKMSKLNSTTKKLQTESQNPTNSPPVNGAVAILANKIENYSDKSTVSCIAINNDMAVTGRKTLVNDCEEADSYYAANKIKMTKCELPLLIEEIKQQAKINSDFISSYKQTRIKAELEKYSNAVLTNTDEVFINKAITQLKKLQHIWFKNITGVSL